MELSQRLKPEARVEAEEKDNNTPAGKDVSGSRSSSTQKLDVC